MNSLTGVRCPSCGNGRSSVIDSRDSPTGKRRKRVCFNCSEIYVTWEKAEAVVHVYDVTNLHKALSKMKLALEAFEKEIGAFENVQDDFYSNNC